MGIPATITLTSAQVDSILAQQGGHPPIDPPPVDPPPVDPPPTAGVNVIDLPWDSHAQRTYTRDHGGFPVGGSVALRFTTGPMSTDSRGQVPLTTSFQGGGIQGPRTVVISETAGDFDNYIRNNMAECKSGNNDGSQIVVGIGAAPMGIPVLQPNKTYFMNVRYDGAHLGEIEAYIAKPGYLA